MNDQLRNEDLINRVMAEKWKPLLAIVKREMNDRARRYKGTSAVVQSAVTRAMTHPNTPWIDSEDELFIWLATFVRTHIREVCKRVEVRTREQEDVRQYLQSLLTEHADSEEFDEAVLESIKECLALLNEEQSLILKLKLDGMTHREIGQALLPPREEKEVTYEVSKIRKVLTDCLRMRREGHR